MKCGSDKNKIYWTQVREVQLPKKRALRHANPEHVMFLRVKARSKQNHILFDLSESDISIPRFCPVLGLELKVNWGKTPNTDRSPTLDRFVPSLGYVKGNIRVVSQLANRIKNSGTSEQVLAVGNWMRKIEQEIS